MLSSIPLEFPSPSVVIFGALLALAWSYSCLSAVAVLKMKIGLRTGYTRKLFHALIFMSAVVVQTFGGFVAVCVFGTMVSCVVALAVCRGPNNGLYEALAREQDGPARTYYIVVPHFATMLGGLASNILFGPLALVGYLVGGLGDAAGEPVGTRWGRHPYLSAAKATKTVEGSIAVLSASVAALLIGVAIIPELHFDLRSVFALPVIAMVCTLVEALSPRGWDNVFMQIVPTLLVATWLLK